jgi:hypothetical protein
MKIKGRVGTPLNVFLEFLLLLRLLQLGVHLALVERSQVI